MDQNMGVAQNNEMEKENLQTVACKLVLSKDLFPLDVIRTACFDFLDKAFTLFEEQQDRIQITLQPNDPGNADTLPKEFQNHLIQLTSAHLHRHRNEELRELVRMHAQRAQVQVKETGFDDPDFADLEKSLADLQSDALDDPLGISEPWTSAVKK